MDGIKKFSPVSTGELLKRCQDILNKSPDWMDERKRHAAKTFIEVVTIPKDEFGRDIKD
jgi:hypothetical protein